MNLTETLAAAITVMALYHGIIAPAVTFLRRWLVGCEHASPAVFTVGDENNHIVRHCFTCHRTQLNDGPWKDYGVRSGNEVNELIDGLNSQLREDFTPEQEGEDIVGEGDEPTTRYFLPLPERVARLLEITQCGSTDAPTPNAVVLGRAELVEAMPFLIAGLERDEQFRIAVQLKSLDGDIDSPVFLEQLPKLQIHGLRVIPSLENDSCLAIADA